MNAKILTYELCVKLSVRLVVIPANALLAKRCGCVHGPGLLSDLMKAMVWSVTYPVAS